MNLQGKKVIVTGGARGIGRCIVEKLFAKGAKVTVFDISTQGLSLLKQQRPDVNCVECDVSDYGQVVPAIAVYYEKFGAPDILINNAGILYSSPLIRITETGIKKHSITIWNKVLASDLSSVFYMTVCVAEKMIYTRTRGVIINISSVSASGNAGQSAYSAAKAGVNALTAVWAKELGPMGIRVVAVSPGYSDTESMRQALSKTTLKEIINKVPLRRLGRPEEIADGVISVIENDFFNGKVIELDGGLVI